MDSALLAPFGTFALVFVMYNVAVTKLWNRYQASEAARVADLQTVLPALTQASAAVQQATAAMTEVARVTILLRDGEQHRRGDGG